MSFHSAMIFRQDVPGTVHIAESRENTSGFEAV